MKLKFWYETHFRFFNGLFTQSFKVLEVLYFSFLGFQPSKFAGNQTRSMFPIFILPAKNMSSPWHNSGSGEMLVAWGNFGEKFNIHWTSLGILWRNGSSGLREILEAKQFSAPVFPMNSSIDDDDCRVCGKGKRGTEGLGYFIWATVPCVTGSYSTTTVGGARYLGTCRTFHIRVVLSGSQERGFDKEEGDTRASSANCSIRDHQLRAFNITYSWSKLKYRPTKGLSLCETLA